jgi:alpha-tubulin suppressor-like RCC1 family protein
VSAQSVYVCARGANNTAKCWGWNNWGTLGLGDKFNRGDNPGEMGVNLPTVPLGTGRSVLGIYAGYDHACAVLNGGDVKCWGYNGTGQLGIGSTAHRGDNAGEMGDLLPVVNLGIGKTATQVALGSSHSCALLQDGSVKCWGGNGQGPLGGALAGAGSDPSGMGDNLPTVNLGTGKTALQISAGVEISCAILNDGSLKCWGANMNGRLGQGHTSIIGDSSASMGDNLLPIALGTGKTAVKVATGRDHVCAILNDGSVKCWGNNADGQLGLGDTNHRGDNPGEMGDDLPSVDLGTGKTAIDIGVNYAHTCAVLNDGSVKCWGGDVYGSLGLEMAIALGDQPGEMGDNLPTVNLGTGKTATAIAVAQYGNCAILNDGKVKCWGNNSNGQLGLGDTLNRGNLPFSMGDNLPAVSIY